MNKILQEKSIIGLLIAYFLFIGLGALKYPEGARLFPLVISIPAFFLCGILFYGSLRKKETAPHRERELETADPQGKKRRVVAFLVAPVYFIIVGLIGYVAGTALLLFFVPWTLGYRRWGKLVLIIVGFLFAIWLLFEVVLLTPLPPGLLLRK